MGSNLGDKTDNLNRAVALLKENENIKVIQVSSFYETDPVGYLDQDVFVNIAVKVETSLLPLELLDYCQFVEQELKRVRKIRWGPRSIDVDILTYDETMIDEERLTVPHPRMFERAFVLIPLKEICNDDMIYGVDIKKELSGMNLEEVRKI